jgi:hypothetical protein
MKVLALSILLTVATQAAKAQQPPAAFDRDFPVPDSPFQPDLTPGYVLIEGDIQVPWDQYRYITSLKGGVHADATYGGVSFWPNNTVPFDFVTSGGGAVSLANQTNAINAMTNIAARAGITFRPAVASDADRIRFQNSTVNNSPVGMQGGTQIINIVNWGNQIIICHEIYHSLGFWHEQSRPDRGTFVTINANNICGSDVSTACTDGTGMGQCCFCIDMAGNCISCAFNFNIQAGASTYGPYDFGSFMHYGPTAFSCNGQPTITVNAPFAAQWQNAIGQRNRFSYFDGITCRALYPFPNDRWLDRNYAGSSTGTFAQPYKNTTLSGALANVPAGGTLLIKSTNTYSAVGTYSTPVTILAPNGATLGN